METAIQINKTSPMAMASEFIKADSNVDIDKLSKLLDIQERWEKNEAKKAYVESMAAFKLSPPVIEKDRHVKFQTKTGGITEYKHASLQNVTSTINEALSKHGLTASWTTKQNDATVTVTCKITHIFGHSEETSLTSGHDNTGNKNPIQALASSISYLERYTLLALTGLATEDMDDDGKTTTNDKEPENTTWTDKQNEFAEKLKISLEDDEKGKGVKLDKIKKYLEWASRQTGQPIPDDDKKISKLVSYLLKKTETLNTLKGEAA